MYRLFALLLCTSSACVFAQADDAWVLPVLSVQGQAGEIPADHVLSNQQLSMDIAELLRQASGTQTRSAGGLGGYSEVSLRGNAARQVQVLFDGIPLELAGGQAINLALFPSAAVAEAEIFQGSAPLGMSGGAAGAVNLLPPKPDQIETRLDLSYGSFDSQRYSLRHNSSGGLFSLGYESSDNDFPIVNRFKPFDPSDPERQRPEPRRHAAVEQQFGLWRYATDAPLGAFNTLIYGFQQQQQLPDRVNSPDPRTQLDSDLLLLGNRLQTDTQHEFQFNLQQHRQHFSDPGSRIGLGEQDLRMRSRRVGLSWLQSGRWNWRMHTSWHDYQQKDQLNDNANNTAQRWRLGTGVQTQLSQHLSVRAELDYLSEESRQRDSRPRENWVFQPALLWSRSLNASCRVHNELSQRTRLAGFVERFGDRGYLKGNPQLKDERLVGMDLGLVCRPNKNSRLSTQLFAQRLRDAISMVYDSQGVGRAQNSAKAQIWGLQADADWSIHPLISWRLSATYMDTEDRSRVRSARGQQLPGRARWQGYSQLRLLASTTSRWSLVHEFEFASGQFYDLSNLRKAPSTRLHHSSLDYRSRQWRISLQARNWLDQTHAQFNGFPQPGRQYFINLSRKL